MNIEIKEVRNKKDLKTFLKVPFAIFEGNDCWVPPIISQEMGFFNKKKNPAFEQTETRLFTAHKNGKAVGRVAAILSHVANEKYNAKNLRFGWFDTIDDYEVAKALLGTLESWAKEKGMETITGPHGFTDFDPEGMLYEGYDQLATIAVYYNHPYYNDFVQKYGFEKDIDYVEFRAVAPSKEEGIPPKLLRLGERIKERSGVSILKFKRKKDLISRAEEIFELLDEAYEELYGTVPLTREMITYYVKQYFPFVDPDLVPVAVNEEGKVIGFMVSMPSLSRGFQKARGKLLPFGWYHLLRALKNYKILDFYLAGIKKEYRGQGIDLLMVLEVVKHAIERGVKFSESNPELETNKKIQAQWKYFNPTLHKRRRIYKKQLG